MTELLEVKSAMSSLEIAELTGKAHSNVMRDIRNLLEQGVNQFNFEAVDYTDKKGEKRPCFNLTPKGVLILASGYDAVLREKIIDRLEELEMVGRQAERPALPDNRTERTLTRMRNTRHYTKADGDREVVEVCKRLYGDKTHPAKDKRHRADYERAKKSLVFAKNGVPVTSSLAIARLRGSAHGNVLDTVRRIQRRMPELTAEVWPSHYMARTVNGARGHGWLRQPMFLLTRKAFTAYAAVVHNVRQGTFAPIIDAFDHTETGIVKRTASEGQADLFGGTDAQPAPPMPPTPTPPVTAAATPTQGDMAERMIAAMAVLTGADIRKVQDIMRKGGAL